MSQKLLEMINLSFFLTTELLFIDIQIVYIKHLGIPAVVFCENKINYYARFSSALIKVIIFFMEFL